MKSFAQSAKDEMCEAPLKSLAQKKALLYGMFQYMPCTEDGEFLVTCANENVVSLFERLVVEVRGGECEIDYFGNGIRVGVSDNNTLAAVHSAFGDLIAVNTGIMPGEKLLSEYFKGAFLVSGSVNSPSAAYHLEIETPNCANAAASLLDKIGINFKYSVRSGVGVLYLKESSAIEDFLNFIGARTAGFALINERIKREIRGNVNRQKNFDLANLKKTVAAGEKYTVAIRKLISTNRIKVLPADLQVTAKLKYENPGVGLAELAALHQPAISKSGVYPRLEKLLDEADKL